VWPAERAICGQCGARLVSRDTKSLQRVWAWWTAGVMCYIPANLYPIMITNQLGTSESSTILGGVILLIHHDAVPIALVIFLFSVIVPLGKLMAMYYLIWTVKRHSPVSARQRTIMYKVTEFIGKWSMVDVFVVAILVALVRLGGLLSIEPGLAAVFFASLVILTMIAAESFDPRLIWDELENKERDN